MATPALYMAPSYPIWVAAGLPWVCCVQCTCKSLDSGMARAGGSVTMQIVVTYTGTSPLLLFRISGRESMGGKWLVNRFLQVTGWFPVGTPDRHIGVWWKHSVWWSSCV